MNILRISFYFLLTSLLTLPACSRDAHWRTLDDGLELARFPVSDSTFDDSALVALRVDPDYWELKMVTASETGTDENKTARGWSEAHGLTAAINAGMFDIDYKSHTGYMRLGDHINCGLVNKYQSAVAFGPRHDTLPYFKIYDLDSDSLSALNKIYDNIAQNLRLIKRPRDNRWTPQERKWAEAALAEDKDGRILFLYCRVPVSMYEFNELILKLPLDIVCAQHLEGGPEAQLYIADGDFKMEMIGNSETNLAESDSSAFSWAIPNVLGIVKRTQPAGD